MQTITAPKKKFIPSFFQQAIFDWIVNGVGNLVINAVAGSGKTTTIVKCMDFIASHLSICFLAFNKSIVEELTSRVPKHVNVQTLHSLGFSGIRKTYKGVSLDNYRVKTIISQFNEEWKEEYEYCNRVHKLVDLIRQHLVFDLESLTALAIKQDLEIVNGECERALQVFSVMGPDSLGQYTKIDFVDMLYIAATDPKVKLDQYDWVFIDECQDLSPVQHLLFQKIKKAEGRHVAVGDRNQAIYAFAGADAHSFDTLCNLPNTTQLPLSVNYRCPKSGIALAKTIVPQIEAHEGAAEGVLDENGKVEHIQDGDFVLCRNTAPLVKLCLEFLKEGKKAYVKGGDIGASLVSLIQKSKTSTLKDLWQYLAKEHSNVYFKLKTRYPFLSHEDLVEHNTYVLFAEKMTVLQVIAEAGDVATPKDLIAKINFIFRDKSPGVCFSTIHKAKGMETDNVHIIERALMPSKYAKTAEARAQEENLRYVAVTRHKASLRFVSDWSFKK
jgi:DNA helicase-2/ATP-dependent DNA helicase PcrA